jgi:uncharacterized protein YlaI
MKGTSCFVCGKKELSRNEIGLNKKLLGRSIKNFYCQNCLAEYLEVDSELLLEKVQEFKEHGCTLFV